MIRAPSTSSGATVWYTSTSSERSGVNYEKIDAALAGALEEASEARARSLTVFIHVDPAAADREVLARLGVSGGSGEGGVLTSDLSPQDVAELSRQDWVHQLRLSGRLRLLQE